MRYLQTHTIKRMSETLFVSTAEAQKHLKIPTWRGELWASTKQMNKTRLLLVPGVDVTHVNQLVERFNKGTDEMEEAYMAVQELLFVFFTL